MQIYSNHAGIYLTTTKIQLVEITYSENRFYLENADEEYFADFLKFEDKETKFVTILQKSFDEIIYRSPLHSDKISFTLPSDVFKVFEIPYEEALRKTDLLEHLQWEMNVLYPGTLFSDYSVQFTTIDGKYSGDKKLMVFALPKEIVRSLNKFCRRNNLELKIIDNDLLSVNNIVSLIHGDQKSKNYILMLLRDNLLVFSVFNDNQPIYYRTKKISSINNTLSVVNSELTNLSKYFQNEIELETAYLSGVNLSEKMIKEMGESTGLSLVVLNPFENLSYNFKSDKLPHDKFALSNYSPSAGVSFRLV